MNVVMDELRYLTPLARRKVQESGVGCMHAMWDVVFDAEALLSGRHSVLTAEETLNCLRDYLCRKYA